MRLRVGAWLQKVLHGRQPAGALQRIHMHLLETPYQRVWADRAFPEGVVRYLADIGFLSSRTTLAHCTHARPEELDLIAQHGARIVTNFSSNLHLHSGLAPIADAWRRGCAVAVGTDGLALDEDDDALREMRLVQMAQVLPGKVNGILRTILIWLMM